MKKVFLFLYLTSFSFILSAQSLVMENKSAEIDTIRPPYWRPQWNIHSQKEYQPFNYSDRWPDIYRSEVNTPFQNNDYNSDEKKGKKRKE
jgi:hypothetical protein